MKHCYAAACTMVKDEPDLREWAAYHLAIGFEHLLIYDNESLLPVTAVLGDFVAAGHVTVFTVAGRFKQCVAVYPDVLDRSRGCVRWMAFLDADEFILPHKTDDVRIYLESMEKFSGIGVNWQMFGDNGHLSRPSGDLLENYIRRGPEDYPGNKHIKSIVNPSDALWPCNPHAFHLREVARMVDADGVTLPVHYRFRQASNMPPKVSSIQINHYYTRSLEDFQAKQRRGGGATVSRREDRVFTGVQRYCNAVIDERILRFRPAMAAKREEMESRLWTRSPGWRADALSLVSEPKVVSHRPAVDTPGQRLVSASIGRSRHNFRDSLLCILTCYNERRYLPAQLEYLDAVGAKVMVIDNYSDDGSWEYLQELGVPGVRLDTEGRFDLPALQGMREILAHSAQARWLIYGDVDEYSFHGEPKNFHRLLEALESSDCNALRLPSFNFYNTGEAPPWQDLPLHFFHGQPRYEHEGGICRIHRYHPDMRYFGDAVTFPGIQFHFAEDGVNCNYGGVKSAAERAEVLRRRRLAWENGLAPVIGAHYHEGERRQWRWQKSELQDIRATERWLLVREHFAALGRFAFAAPSDSVVEEHGSVKAARPPASSPVFGGAEPVVPDDGRRALDPGTWSRPV